VDKWAGLRKRSRETQLPMDNDAQPRVLSIFGGKLTGYRATAEKVVKQLQRTLPNVAEIARTDQLSLSAKGLDEIKRTN